jgi:hypothetical protein
MSCCERTLLRLQVPPIRCVLHPTVFCGHCVRAFRAAVRIRAAAARECGLRNAPPCSLYLIADGAEPLRRIGDIHLFSRRAGAWLRAPPLLTFLCACVSVPLRRLARCTSSIVMCMRGCLCYHCSSLFACAHVCLSAVWRDAPTRLAACVRAWLSYRHQMPPSVRACVPLRRMARRTSSLASCECVTVRVSTPPCLRSCGASLPILSDVPPFSSVGVWLYMCMSPLLISLRSCVWAASPPDGATRPPPLVSLSLCECVAVHTAARHFVAAVRVPPRVCVLACHVARHTLPIGSLVESVCGCAFHHLSSLVAWRLCAYPPHGATHLSLAKLVLWPAS